MTTTFDTPAILRDLLPRLPDSAQIDPHIRAPAERDVRPAWEDLPQR